MKNSKKFRNILKKIIYLILIMSILIINTNTLTVVFAESENINIPQTQEQKANIVRVADASTVDDYKENIQGGRYNGRVWTDKSVYANNGDGQVTLDDKFNIQYDDDFLTVFSALGSSQSIEQNTALDISIIIDVSGSMGYDVVDNLKHADEETRIAHSRIQATITAVNNAIDKLMNFNEKNRVCVVAYGGTAFSLMELGHYTKVEDSNEYITVEDFKAYNEKDFNESGQSAYTLCVHAKKDGEEIINRTVRNNYTINIPKDKYKNIDACIGFNTNMQAGIYEGFQELYDNVDSEILRFPTAIIMTDGGSNYALKKNNTDITGDEWNNVPIATSLSALNNSYKKYRTETNEMGKGGKETILDILMTASYMKAKVQKKYEEIFKQSSTVQYNNSLKFKIHTVSVDTTEMLYLETAKWQVPRIYTTLDPKNYFKEDLSDVTWEFKQDSIDAYKLWQEWKTSPTGVSSTFNDSDGKLINFKINKLQDENEVTNEEIIKNIYYNDSFKNITSEDMDSFLSDIIANAAFNPIENGKNETENSNVLSYTDPIGKYMEIKEVKKLLLFGKEYNIIKDGEPIIEDVNGQKISKQYYKAVDSSNNDLEMVNPRYEDEAKFKLSDIKIWKETSNDNNASTYTNFDESLHITIPSNAIPIYLEKIKLNELNKVKGYETNKNTDFSLPIRVVYTIGISNQIINENTKEIDLTKISKEYFTEKSEEIEENGNKETYMYLFSNYYSGESYNEPNGKTSGNATTTFIPSSDNRFYVFQDNLTIYKKSSGGNDAGEGEIKETGGNVVLSDPVTDLNEINPEETYYFAIDYYLPEESNGLKGRYVQYATSHKGKEFFGENGESYLTYYNTERGQAVDKKESNVVVVTKKGTKKIESSIYLSNRKENNTTKTAELYYVPSYGHTQDNEKDSVLTYLGNNGRLAIKISSGQELPKEETPNVKPSRDILPYAGKTINMILLIIIISFISFCLIFYKKYKKYNY